MSRGSRQLVAAAYADSEASRNADTTDAAQRCVTAIEARFAKATESNTLLRASEPAVSTDTLVRPAATSSADGQEQLLRASGTDQEDMS